MDNHRTSLLKRKQTRRQEEEPSFKRHRKPEAPSSKGHWKPEDPSSKGHRKPEELSPKKQRKAEYPYVLSSQDADFRRHNAYKSRQPPAQTTATRTTAPLRRHTNKPRDDEVSSSTASSHTRRLSLQDDARESELSAVRHQHTRRVRHWGNERHDTLVMTKRRPLRHNHSTLQRELSKLQHNQVRVVCGGVGVHLGSIW